MALPHLNYAPSLRRPRRAPRIDYTLLEAAEALATQGRGIESLTKVLQHLFPTATIPDLATEPFTFIQGSSRVTVRVEGEALTISVPVVRLPAGGGAIAALRYVLTNLGGAGQLHQPRLRGDALHLEYRDRMSRLHPAKLVEVLRSLPGAADRSDDWLIAQFSAQPLERAQIDPLTDDEIQRADAIWREHWNDVEELLLESQRKRSGFFLNELSTYAIHRIALALPLCGVLGARIQESAATFDNTREPALKREAALARCTKEMKAITAEELRANLGHGTYAISPLQEGTAALLTSYFGGGNYIETIDKLRGAGHALDAALALICTYTYLLARFSWPEPVERELEAGLALASGKPWREVASALWTHAKELVARFGAGGEPDATEGGAA